MAPQAQRSRTFPHQPSEGIRRRPTTELGDDYREGANTVDIHLKSHPNNDHLLSAVSAWESELSTLTPQQRALFPDNVQTGSFVDYVKSLQEAIETKTDSGFVFRIARNIKPIYDLVNRISPVASAAGQFTPAPLAFSAILGGITTIIATGVRVDDYREKLVEMLTSMASELRILDKYAAESIFADDLDVQASHINVATDILKFCVAAVKLFYNDQGKERSGLRLALKAQWKDFDTQFGNIKKTFKHHLAELEKWRVLANSRRLRSLQANMEAAGQSLNRNHAELKEIAEQLLDNDTQLAMLERRRRILSWLPSMPFARIQEDTFDRRVPRTGEWLVQHPDFLRWRDSKMSSLLWVHGKAGSGKSHLAAKVVHDIQQQREDPSVTAVAYVYCSTTRSDTEMSFNNLLASILAQLYDQLPLFEDVSALGSRATSGSKEGPQRAEMKEWITLACSKFDSCFIVVDGLDECSHFQDDHFADLCNFIASLTEVPDTPAPIKLLVFSRPNYLTISSALAKFPQLPVDHGANEADIQAYVSLEVDKINPDSSPEEIEGFEQIKQKMLSQADGMFLYVKLKMVDLREIGNVEDILETLQDSTEGLDDLYQQAIRRILGRSRFVRDRALKALLWVTNSYRRLSKAELLDALSTKPGRKQLKANQRLSRDLPLATECADLLVEIDGSYQLIHASLREFLCSRTSNIPEYGDLQRQADAALTETCLTYLTFDDFRKASIATPAVLSQLIDQYPLLGYAADYWGEHFNMADEADETDDARRKHLNTLTEVLFSSPGSIELAVKTVEYNEFKGRILFPGSPTPLHLAAIFNLHKLATAHPSWSRFLNWHDHLLHLPIDYAFIYEAKEMVLWILDQYQEHPANSAQSFSRCLDCCQLQLLHNAAHLDWGDVIESLISLGHNVLAPDELSRKMPLQIATEFGKYKALAALLKAGAAPDTGVLAPDQYDRTPLLTALRAQDTRAVSLLLEAGAEVNPLYGDRSPLQIAARRGDVENIQQLLLRGANFDASDNRKPPLHEAIDARRYESAEILINHGAPLELRDPSEEPGHTPLTLAVRRGDVEILGLLIRHGADIKSTNREYGANGLHLAGAYNNVDVAKFLLDHCQDLDFVDALDIDIHTPFQKALEKRSWPVARTLLENGARSDLTAWARFLPTAFFSCLARTYHQLSIEDKSDTIAEILMKLSETAMDTQRQPALDGDAETTSPAELWDAGLSAPEVLEQVRTMLDNLAIPEFKTLDPETQEIEPHTFTIRKNVWRFARLVLDATDDADTDFDDTDFGESENGSVSEQRVENSAGDGQAHLETQGDQPRTPRSETLGFTTSSMVPDENIHWRGFRQEAGDSQGKDDISSTGTTQASSPANAHRVVEDLDSSSPRNSPSLDVPLGQSVGDPAAGMWTEIRKNLVTADAIRSRGYDFEEADEFFYVKRKLSYGEIRELLDMDAPKPTRNERPSNEMWTEITKDLVTLEAIHQMGYVYEETEYFFYIKEYLTYDQVYDLVMLSDDLRAKGQRGRAGELRSLRWQLRRRWYKYKSRSGETDEGHHPLRKAWDDEEVNGKRDARIVVRN